MGIGRAFSEGGSINQFRLIRLLPCKLSQHIILLGFPHIPSWTATRVRLYIQGCTSLFADFPSLHLKMSVPTSKNYREPGNLEDILHLFVFHRSPSNRCLLSVCAPSTQTHLVSTNTSRPFLCGSDHLLGKQTSSKMMPTRTIKPELC